MPNEPLQTVNVTGSEAAPVQRQYRGLSPIQAALLYGGAASAVAGPLGLLAGLGAGIIAGRSKKSWLDREAQYTQLLADGHSDFRDEVNSEMQIADEDEKRLLSHARRIEAEGWNRLVAGDGTGREMINQANEITRSIIQGDIQARKAEQANVAQFQRTLVQDSARSYREEYQKNLSQFEDIQSQADRVLKIVSSKGFDPNKPFNKAVLTDLLTVGVGGLYRDAPDVVGSIPFVGEFLERGSDWLTGKFELTAEDFNRVALSMKEANEMVSETRMLRLGEQSRNLDQFARQTGAIPQDYSLGSYVTGEVQELNFTPVPKFEGRETAAPIENLTRGKGLFSDSEMMRRIDQWKQRKKSVRPTN